MGNQKGKGGLGMMLCCAGRTEGLEKRGESRGQKAPLWGSGVGGDKHTELLFQPVNDRI